MYKYAVIDIESTGLSRFKDNINYIGIGLAKDIGQPLSKTYILNMYEDKDLQRFKNIVKKLRENKVKCIWQNGKFDTLFIDYKYGIMLPIHHDVMVMGTAYDLAAEHGLDKMAEKYLGIPSWDIPLREKKKPNNPIVEEYLGYDISVPWDLFNYFWVRMSDIHWKAYNNILMPAFKMYRKVEKTGIYLDRKQLKIVKKQYKEKEAERLAILKSHYDINWNSPPQVAEVLFGKDGEGLPTIKLSEKTGKPSSDVKVMKRLVAKGYELPQKLTDWKFYYGANTKFLNKWGTYASYDGRIHPSFGITNVRTGRTSCSDPNLQQVPRNKELRTLYTAEKGRKLIEADYSQIELRIAADYANDPTMIKIYKTGGDIHTTTGCSLAGCKPEDLPGELRSKAKAVNFGFLYGMSARGFIDYAFDSYNAVFSKDEAERYRQLFFAKYSRLEQWHKEMEQECEMLGGVANRFGRFRALPDVYSSNRWDRSSAIRKAINTPVQSTASDLLLAAACQIDELLRKEMDGYVVGTVHDAVLTDVPDEYVDDAIVEIKRIMKHPKILDIYGVSFKVPIEADVGVGAWGSK